MSTNLGNGFFHARAKKTDSNLCFIGLGGSTKTLSFNGHRFIQLFTINDCFLELQAIRLSSRNTHEPEVERLLSRSLAQSESLYAFSEILCNECARARSNPWELVPLRYLNIRLTTLQ